jgi:hypothetical protein
MSVSLTIRQELTATETLAAADIPTISSSATDSSRVVHSAFNRSGSRLNASSVPPVDAVVFDELTTDGADTIDLTNCKTAALPTGGADMTAKKVVAALFSCPATNAAAIVITPGASNPYPIFGTGNDISIPPGGHVQISFVGVVSPLPAVSGTVKTLDITGTATDVLNYEIVLGTPA